jgi:hypothetical protein
MEYDKVGGELYSRSLTDWRFLYYNIIYHFGEIFSNFKSIITAAVTGGDTEGNYF